MTLPPQRLAQDLVQAFGQAIYLDVTARRDLLNHLNPLQNQQMQGFISFIEQGGDVAAAQAVLAPAGAPSDRAQPLAEGLVAALAPVLSDASSYIRGSAGFEGLGWTVQRAPAPGPVTPEPPAGNWTLDDLAPRGGLVPGKVGFDAGTFTLQLTNDQPRHLAVYASFVKDGQTVSPAGWTSRLPVVVDPGFETATVKYIGILTPNAAVAGVAMPAGPQILSLPLPDNADSLRLYFAGPGRGAGPVQALAAGMALSLVLDVFLPWVIVMSGQGGAAADAWLKKSLADADTQAAVLAAATPLLQEKGAAPEMLAALGAQMTAMILDPVLAPLCKSLDKLLGRNQDGQPPSYTWSQQFAPGAGWAAQLLAALLPGGTIPGYWPATSAAAMPLVLAPNDSLSVSLAITPDPVAGSWPFGADKMTARLDYGPGYSQILTMDVPAQGAPLAFAFGGLRNAGPIKASVTAVADSCPLASAEARLTPEPPGGTRSVTGTATLVNRAPALTANTTYTHQATLALKDGAFVWQTGAAAATQIDLRENASGASIGALGPLRWQGGLNALTFSWQAMNQSIPDCDSGARLQAAWMVQTLGSVAPGVLYGYRTCGTPAQPFWAVDALMPPGAGEAAAYFLDTGTFVDPASQSVSLAPVTLSGGQITPAQVSVGTFTLGSGLSDLAAHPAGVVAAVGAADGRLQLLPVDAFGGAAPPALDFAGFGTMPGQLEKPVAVAALPQGGFLVLDAGRSQLAAFDLFGAALTLFSGSATVALDAGSGAQWLDLAVSPSGRIYVLGKAAAAASPADFTLSVLSPDGKMVSRTSGVAAARIAVDGAETLYALTYAGLTGPDGTLQPDLSLWVPHEG